jgi:hypothetical protein
MILLPVGEAFFSELYINAFSLLGQLYFDPCAAASAGLVDGIRPLCDQAFELELARDLKKLFFRSPQLLGEANIVRSVLQDLCCVPRNARVSVAPDRTLGLLVFKRDGSSGQCTLEREP